MAPHRTVFKCKDVDVHTWPSLVIELPYSNGVYQNIMQVILSKHSEFSWGAHRIVWMATMEKRMLN